MARALQLVAEANEDDASACDGHRPGNGDGVHFKRRRLDSCNAPTSLFQTASGSKTAPPSEDSFAKVATLLSDSMEPETPKAPLPLQPLSVTASLFTTARGSSIAGSSTAARQAVAHLFDEDEEIVGPRSSAVTVDPGLPLTGMRSSPSTSLFTTANGASIAGPSRAARQTVAHLFAEDGGITDSVQSAADRPSVPQRTSTSLLQPQFRTPLRPTTNTMSNLASPVPSSQARGKAIDLRTPQSALRIGLGSSSTTMGTARRKGFITPFRKGGTPSVSTIRAPAGKTPTIASERIHEPVFDITSE